AQLDAQLGRVEQHPAVVVVRERPHRCHAGHGRNTPPQAGTGSRGTTQRRSIDFSGSGLGWTDANQLWRSIVSQVEPGNIAEMREMASSTLCSRQLYSQMSNTTTPLARAASWPISPTSLANAVFLRCASSTNTRMP